MRYRMGNGMRELKQPIVADSDREAWEKGCALFEQAVPTESGRVVWLSKEVIILNLSDDQPETSFVTIAKGSTHDKWGDRPDNVSLILSPAAGEALAPSV